MEAAVEEEKKQAVAEEVAATMPRLLGCHSQKQQRTSWKAEEDKEQEGVVAAVEGSKAQKQGTDNPAASASK